MSKAVALVLALVAVGSARWIQPVWNNWNWNGLNTLPVRSLPTVFSSPSVAVAPAAWAGYAPAFSASQYHAQDELGQASFGYSHPGQAASNFRDAFGNQAGSWSYIDSEGKPVVVNYIADANGFRVVSNNLPVAPAADMTLPQPVVDTPEVAEAKAAHMAALRAAEANNGAVAVPLNLPMPVQVEDTPEVAAAKAEHLRVWTEAKMRAEQA